MQIIRSATKFYPSGTISQLGELLAGRTAFALVRFPGSSVRWLAISASVSFVVSAVGLFTHPAVLALNGLTMSIFFPTAMAWIQDRFGVNADRMIASAIAAVGLALVISHFGVGALTDAVGIRNALLVGPVCLVGVLGLLRGLRS